MYSYEFVRHALQVLRGERVSRLERTYEKLRDQMAHCHATVVVNGTRYAYGCVVPSSAASTRVRLQQLYSNNLLLLNAELRTHFQSWEEVVDMGALFANSMTACAAVLKRTALEPGNAQRVVESLLDELHAELEQAQDFTTCMRECAVCEGDTVETHFGCLARSNSHVSLQEWYVVMLGFLAHSAAQGSYLPYYSRVAHIPDVHTAQTVIEFLESRWWSQPGTWASTLADAWCLPPTTPLATPEDIVALLPPTVCHTLELFENLVHAQRLAH